MLAMSSREFNRDVSAAKRAATADPVVITDRGDPAFVLISIDEYRRLRGEAANVADALVMSEDIEFEPVRLQGLPRAVEL